jgi:4,5-DOPA dioxygenase extradiol
MTSIPDPAVPAGAYDQFLPGALPCARAQRQWTPADGPLPALYLSHGAPPLFDDGPWLRSCSSGPSRCPGRRAS